jgi:hypothetical protein
MILYTLFPLSVAISCLDVGSRTQAVRSSSVHLLFGSDDDLWPCWVVSRVVFAVAALVASQRWLPPSIISRVSPSQLSVPNQTQTGPSFSLFHCTVGIRPGPVELLFQIKLERIPRLVVGTSKCAINSCWDSLLFVVALPLNFGMSPLRFLWALLAMRKVQSVRFVFMAGVGPRSCHGGFNGRIFQSPVARRCRKTCRLASRTYQVVRTRELDNTRFHLLDA